jgi:hypothetical protein
MMPRVRQFGDRMTMLFAAVHESLLGTSLHSPRRNKNGRY